jgi:hypothetical protein
MFVFRLALALGMTVKQLLCNIDAKELEEWRYFYDVEPWGYIPEEIRNASLRRHMSMMMSKKSFDLIDFVLSDHPDFQEIRKVKVQKKQTVSEIKNHLFLIHKSGAK